MTTPDLTHEYAESLENTINYKKGIFDQAQEQLNSGGGMDMMVIQYAQELGIEIHTLEIELQLLQKHLDQ